MILLLIWCCRGSEPRYFRIPEKKFGRDNTSILLNLANQKFSEYTDDDVYDRLWCVRSAVSGPDQWIPMDVPKFWNGSLLRFEIFPPVGWNVDCVVQIGSVI